MKSIHVLTFAAALLAFGTTGCNDKDFLDVPPRGALSDEQLNTPENADKQVVAAYSALANDGFTVPYTSLWPYGNLRSGDAYKGGGGIGDIEGFHFYETFTYNRTDVGNTDEVWFRLFVGIGRANDALRRLGAVTDAQMPNRNVRIAEARFLRGHFYFILKELFDRVPYLDENVAVDQYDQVSNVALTSQQLWDKIADDFQFGATNLPATQGEVGRASQVAAKAYLAKVRLFQAYVQNETNHQVTSVDPAKLQEVLRLTNEIIGAGKHSLYTDFGNNFMSAFDNGSESVFAIQFSKDDGTPRGRINQGNKLNYPMNAEFGCCSFHQPSQNLVNAFKTDAQGLPLFTTFNNASLTAPADFQTNTVDPRLDHTVAIPTHPWKYDPSFVFQRAWVRVPDVYGQFMSQKELVGPNDPAFQKLPPFMSSTKNWAVIRYADVLLWKAEALIELNRPAEALPIINQIRQRAQSSTSLLKQSNGQATSNYRIGQYPAGAWTQQYAREALRWERRLEFAMEGSRFFDLVRWGIAADYLNEYFRVEKTRRSYLQNANFTRGRDEYLPIPLNQINFSQGRYQQNPGW